MAMSSMVAFRTSEDQLRQAQLVAMLEETTLSQFIRDAVKARMEQVVSQRREQSR